MDEPEIVNALGVLRVVQSQDPQALADALRHLTGARQVAVAYDTVTEDGQVVPGSVAVSKAPDTPDAACLSPEGCEHTREASVSFGRLLLERRAEALMTETTGLDDSAAATNKALNITDEQVAAMRAKVMRDISQAMDIPESFVTPPLPPRDEAPFRFFAPKVEPPNPVRRFIEEPPWWTVNPTAGLVIHGKGCTDEHGCSDDCVTGGDL